MATRNERILHVTENNIDDYINDLTARGRTHITIRKYNRVLRRLYDYLPEDKTIGKDTLERFLNHVLEEREYSNSTINSAITAYNEFVRYMGYGDFCTDRVEGLTTETPIITKEDYHRLLEATQREKDRKGYVLVKLFANTPIRVHDMASVTVEAVREGVLRPKNESPFGLPQVLRNDLLDFAEESGIRTGFIFRTNRNTPIARHLVAKLISGVGHDAGFPDGYITPRSLQKFYSTRIDEIRKTYEPVIASAYEAVLETEQRAIAWKG